MTSIAVATLGAEKNHDMKTQTQPEKSRRLQKLFIALGLAVLTAPAAFAASQIWTNAPVSSQWSAAANWVGNAVPGGITGGGGTQNGDTATFNAPIGGSGFGGVSSPIVLDGINNGTIYTNREVKFVLFDTANCGAYVIGSSGSTYQLSLSATTTPGGNVTVNPTVANPQVITAVHFRYQSSQNGAYQFTNNASASTATLSVLAMTNDSSSTRPLTLTLAGSNTGSNVFGHFDDNGGANGSVHLFKYGSGRWVFTAANDFTNKTSGGDNVPANIAIVEGTLEVEDPGSLGVAALIPVVTNTGTLQIDGITLNQNSVALKTGGTIRMNGAGTLNSIALDGVNAGSVETVATTSASDVLTINGLTVGRADSVLHVAGPGLVILSSDTTNLNSWSFDAGTNRVGSANALGNVSKSLAFGSASTGVLQLYGNSYTALSVTSSPSAGTPVIENGNSGTSVITISNAAANTFAGVIQDGAGGGNLALTKAGLGSLTLSGASTYTGNTTINNGALNVSGSLGSTAVAVNSSATLSGSGSIAGSVSISSGGILLPGGNATVGTLTVGSLTLNSGSSSSFEFNGTTNDLVVVSSSGGLTISGGSVNLYQSDGITPYAAAGTYNLFKYTGSISGSVSSLTVGNPQAGYAYTFGTAGGYVTVAITVAGVNTTWNTDADGNWTDTSKWSGGTVPHSAGDSAKLGVGSALRTVTLNANETIGGLTFTNNNSFVVTGGNTLTLDNKGAGAPLTVQAGTANAIQTAVSLNDNATATVASGKKLSVSGIVSSTSAQTLNVNGAGTLALSGNNTYGPSAGTVGTTLTGGGTLQVAHNNALAAGDVDVTGNSTLQSGAAGLNVPNNVTVESLVNATVDDNGNNFTLSGVIGGNGSLIKNGSGTVVLAGANSYNGNTTVNSGVLSISQDSSLGNYPGTETANSIVLNGGDLLGTANITLTSTRDIGIGAGSGSVGTNALIDAASGTTLSISSVIASAGNTGVNGLSINTGSGNTGTVDLSGVNTFNGPTYIAKGILSLGSSSALQNSVLDYTNGTLLFDGSITAATIAEIVGTQNLALTNSSGAGVSLTLGGDNGSVTYPGNFTDAGIPSGGGALVKQGSGTLTLSGASVLSGDVRAANGTIAIATNSTLVAGSITSSGGSVPLIQVNGGTVTVTNATLCTGGSSGPGNLTISGGTVSVSGTMNINSGSSEASVSSGVTVNTNGYFYANGLNAGRGALLLTTQPGAGQAGQTLIVNGGTVVITNNVTLGDTTGANSGTSLSVNSGVLTIGGYLSFGCDNGGRWSVVDVAGGTLNIPDTVTGIRLGAKYTGAGDVFLVRGGTANVGIITFGNTNNTAATTESTVVNVTGGALYVGAGGFVQAWTNVVPSITLNGGILGASADWTCTNSVTLGTAATIQAADASGTAHNITISGPIGGNSLTKTGAGKLTLTAGNFFTNVIQLNAGTLNINGSWALGGGVYGGLNFGGGTLQFAPAFSGNGPGDFSENTAATPVAVPVTFTANATIDVAGNTVACAYGIGNAGSGGLIVTDSVGGGVLNLQGTNNYSGNTTVSSGTLALGVASINTNSTVSIASGAKLQLNFAGINVVSNLVLNGVAQAPGTYNSTTTPTYFATGTGSLVVPAAGPGTFTATPGITGFSIVGANVVLNGTNGQSGDAYYLLTTTNLTQAINQWHTVATNVFGSNGAFTFTGTNAVTSGSAQQFYRLSNTNYNH
jgi:fibronectin-binding autotransporter adhesin